MGGSQFNYRNKQRVIEMYSGLRTSQRWRFWAACDVLITGDCLSLEKYLGPYYAVLMSELIIKAWGDRGTFVLYEEALPTLMEVPEIRDFILDGVYSPYIEKEAA